MTSQTMPLGIVLEKREIDNKWEPFVWQAVAVIPGAAEIDDWCILEEGPGWTRYHAATLPLEIHRKETEGYKYNLGINPPIVYLLLRYDDDAEYGIVVIAHGMGEHALRYAPLAEQAYIKTIRMDRIILCIDPASTTEHAELSPRFAELM